MIETNVLECVNPLLSRIQIRFAFTCANRDLKIKKFFCNKIEIMNREIFEQYDLL